MRPIQRAYKLVTTRLTFAKALPVVILVSCSSTEPVPSAPEYTEDGQLKRPG